MFTESHKLGGPAKTVQSTYYIWFDTPSEAHIRAHHPKFLPKDSIIIIDAFV